MQWKAVLLQFFQARGVFWNHLLGTPSGWWLVVRCLNMFTGIFSLWWFSLTVFFIRISSQWVMSWGKKTWVARFSLIPALSSLIHVGGEDCASLHIYRPFMQWLMSVTSPNHTCCHSQYTVVFPWLLWDVYKEIMQMNHKKYEIMNKSHVNCADFCESVNPCLFFICIPYLQFDHFIFWEPDVSCLQENFVWEIRSLPFFFIIAVTFVWISITSPWDSYFPLDYLK